MKEFLIEYYHKMDEDMGFDPRSVSCSWIGIRIMSISDWIQNLDHVIVLLNVHLQFCAPTLPALNNPEQFWKLGGVLFYCINAGIPLWWIGGSNFRMLKLL